MPAINPEQLQRQIDDLLVLVHQPERFVRSCVNLLDTYADRTKRPRGSTARIEISTVLRVPRPVMKTLYLRLLGSDEGDWLAIGRGLWVMDIRETRQVAACALAKMSGEVVAEEAQEWALTCEDEEALDALASTGTTRWRTTEQANFYRTLEAWLGDPRIRIRHLGILALQARIRDVDFNELPQVLGLIQGLCANVRGSSQRSLNEMVRYLISISPPEVAKFVIDEVEAGVQGAKRLAQAVIPVFPDRLKKEIQKTLG